MIYQVKLSNGNTYNIKAFSESQARRYIVNLLLRTCQSARIRSITPIDSDSYDFDARGA